MSDKWFDEQAKALKYAVHGGVNVEVGCSFRKVRDDFIGTDPIAKGQPASQMLPCVADIVCTGSTLKEHFKPSSIDFIHAGHSVHYEPDLISMLKSWYELLKPGGTACIIDLEKVIWSQPGWNSLSHCGTTHGFPYHWFTREDAEKAMKEAGFEIIESGSVCEQWSFTVIGRKPNDKVKQVDTFVQRKNSKMY